MADLIAPLFHIRHTPRGVSYLLHRIGWSPQVPVHRAVERDEEVIERWVSSRDLTGTERFAARTWQEIGKRVRVLDGSFTGVIIAGDFENDRWTVQNDDTSGTNEYPTVQTEEPSEEMNFGRGSAKTSDLPEVSIFTRGSMTVFS